MRTKALLTLLALTAALPAAAADDAAEGALVEKVVVRNRLFTVDGRFEVGVNVGFSLLARLTDHYTFDATVAYNLGDTFAVELLAGYAYSRHTSLARDVADQFATSTVTTADDLKDLWEMTANAVIGLRWQPLYGKIGIFSELPIHFQFYIWAGGGAALFKRESVTVCNQTANNKVGGECLNYYQQSEVGPVVSLAAGFRFFLPVYGNHHSIRLEIRDFSYLDHYLLDVNRAAALTSGNPTGNGTETTDITNLTQVLIGYTYIF